MSNAIKIAFIGLGNMGAPMAANLLKADLRVSVYDVQAAPVAALAKLGARAASSSIDAVRDADVVISMLPTGAHVRALYLGSDADSEPSKQGILAHLRAGTLIIECSTIASSDAQALAQAASTYQVAMLDAPVSGGTQGAQAATLSFMLGGDAASVERARPLLEKMGKNIFHAGAVGAGQIAKVCNNMLLGILMAGTAEALNLGVANGVDAQVLSNIMAKSSGRNWALEQYNPWPNVIPGVPASRAYSGVFASKLMLKDLGLAQELANAAHNAQATPLGALVRQMYLLHNQAGHSELDFSSIAAMFGAEIGEAALG